MDRSTLKFGLITVLSNLTQAEVRIRQEAARAGVDPYAFYLSDGQLALAPILIAQAHALAALARLEVRY